ncbi:MAG TPA: efflux RND transporter periplasmic adaptor subunit [Polyangia bacterium]
MWRSRLLSLLVIALAGCPGESEPPPLRPPTVKVVIAEARPLSPTVPIAGVLGPLPGKDVKVGALVAGRVDRVMVAEGDPVKVGQPLAHVEAQPLRDRLSETEAQKEESKAALLNARARQARTERLWKDGIASRQEVDDARAATVSAESALKKAQAMGGTATVQLDRATLRAPIAGVVAAILVPAGQPVDGNGTPVIEIADTRELDLRAPVPAARIGEVAIGQRATLHVEGAGSFDGEVEAIAPLVDTATNTVIVRVRIANQSGRLRGGMFARGALVEPTRNGLAVPKSALLPGDGGAADRIAIVKPDGTVAHLALVLGDEAGALVEVRSGLSAGERVIVSGGYALPDGTKVEIVK